jgi:hypothetical protein
MSSTDSCRISLVGQLGNQMFQIAALINHCTKYNKKIIISIKNNHIYYDTNKHLYYDNYLYKCKEFITNDKFTNNAYRMPFKYNPIPSDTNELHGYFQSSKYFSEIKEKIFEYFDPPPNIKKTVLEKYNYLLTKEKNNIVIVHIRRGDYVNHKVHGILTQKYFNNAMNIFKEKNKNYEFIIFSDDIEYCRNEYPNNIYIDEPDETCALYLMSQFSNYIMSNSTFSWWAVYLGETAKTVITPDPWFGPDGPKDYQDIYESNWIKIKSE